MAQSVKARALSTEPFRPEQSRAWVRIPGLLEIFGPLQVWKVGRNCLEKFFLDNAECKNTGHVASNFLAGAYGSLYCSARRRRVRVGPTLIIGGTARNRFRSGSGRGQVAPALGGSEQNRFRSGSGRGQVAPALGGSEQNRFWLGVGPGGKRVEQTITAAIGPRSALYEHINQHAVRTV